MHGLQLALGVELGTRAKCTNIYTARVNVIFDVYINVHCIHGHSSSKIAGILHCYTINSPRVLHY